MCPVFIACNLVTSCDIAYQRSQPRSCRRRSRCGGLPLVCRKAPALLHARTCAVRLYMSSTGHLMSTRLWQWLCRGTRDAVPERCPRIIMPV